MIGLKEKEFIFEIFMQRKYAVSLSFIVLFPHTRKIHKGMYNLLWDFKKIFFQIYRI